VDPALLAIAAGVGVILIYELVAIISILLFKAGLIENRLSTISGAVWHNVIDREEDGAPIVFLMGYIMGHFVWPLDLSPLPQAILTGATIGIVYMEVNSAITKFRFISRRIYGYGGDPVVFFTAFLLAHFLFPR
jgi:hypothetical protein